MIFNEAQENMKFSYFGGAPGVLVSGMVWLTAGTAALFISQKFSMLTLFFGGMLIHPLAILLSKALKRPGKHKSENPLGKLALETTLLIFIGLFLAFYVAKLQVNWFYPIMLMTIGGRYLSFATLYGMNVYWFLGAVLALSGMFCILFQAPFVFGALIGGALELMFALIIFRQAKEITAITI